MDHFTVSDPTCRTDLSMFLSHHDVDPHDHFRVVTDIDAHVLSHPDERLEVGTDSAALWHDEGCTRIAFEHIEEVEWHGDTIAQRDNADQPYNQVATPMEDAFRKLDRDEVDDVVEAPSSSEAKDEVSELKEVLKQDD